MAEATYEGIVVDAAKAAGWTVRKLKWLCRRGGPDRFFAKEGRIVLIEFKRPGVGAKASKGNQATEVELLRAAGVEVHVCDNHLKALRVLGVPYAAA